MKLSLQSRIALVALAAVVPLLAFYLATRAQIHELASERAAAEVVATAESAAQLHRSLVAEVEASLRLLSHMYDLSARSVEECLELTNGLVGDRSYFTALGLIHPDGRVFCTAPSFDPESDFSDRQYIMEASSTGRPTVSGYHDGRLTGRPAFALAEPILDSQGEVIMIAAAGLDLIEVAAIMGPEREASGYTFTLFDPDGVILLHGAGDDAELPARVPPDLLQAAREGVSSRALGPLTGLDGTSRVVGLAPLLSGSGLLVGYVAVGVDPVLVATGITEAVARNLLWMFFALAGVVAVIILVSQFTIMNRIRPMLRMASRFGAGDLSARTGLPHGDDELGELASTLDRMAENLQNLRSEEHRAAQGEIRLREERLRSIAAAIDEIFWIVERKDGRSLYVSDAYERIWSRPPSAEFEEPEAWIDTVHPEDRGRARLHAGLARTGSEAEAEFRILLSDGSVRWIRDRAFPMQRNDETDATLDEAGTGNQFVRVSQDITQQKRLQEEAGRAHQMEAVGRLAGGVAHDFNNILTAIQGYADFLRENIPEESPLRKDVDEISRSAARATELTHQLLAFGRRQVLQPESLNLSHVVSEMKEIVERGVGEKISVILELDPDPGTIRADRGQIEQILLNLAWNARDAMSGGGTLLLETRPIRLGDRQGDERLGLMEPGEYVLLSITDTGSGMTPEVRARVFEPFFTTKVMGKGSGLGLSTVYGIVKQSGGYVWVYSEPAVGTSFKLYFPRIDLPSHGTGSAGGATRALTSNKRRTRVLLVEDDPGVRAFLRRAMESGGYHVSEAGDGREALARVGEMPSPPDVVLTDVVLPTLTGPQMAGLIKESFPGVRVLFMSGYAKEGLVSSGAVEASDLVLAKPFTPAQLLETLDELCGEESVSGAV